MSAHRPVKWEEPTDSRKTGGDSVGIPAIHGGEDVNQSLLIYPVVGPRGRFFLVLVDIDLEALAIAFVLPVRDGVADAIEERATTQIEPADEHAREMA